MSQYAHIGITHLHKIRTLNHAADLSSEYVQFESLLLPATLRFFADFLSVGWESRNSTYLQAGTDRLYHNPYLTVIRITLLAHSTLL
jgi:hypothetical protein